MHFADLGKALHRKMPRRANQSRPQAAMHVGDLSVDEATNEHLVRASNGPRESKDVAAEGMRPPAAADGPARDSLGKRGHGARRRFEHDAMPPNEGDRLGRRQEPLISIRLWSSTLLPASLRPGGERSNQEGIEDDAANNDAGHACPAETRHRVDTKREAPRHREEDKLDRRKSGHIG